MYCRYSSIYLGTELRSSKVCIVDTQLPTWVQSLDHPRFVLQVLQYLPGYRAQIIQGMYCRYSSTYLGTEFRSSKVCTVDTLVPTWVLSLDYPRYVPQILQYLPGYRVQIIQGMYCRYSSTYLGTELRSSKVCIVDTRVPTWVQSLDHPRFILQVLQYLPGYRVQIIQGLYYRYFSTYLGTELRSSKVFTIGTLVPTWVQSLHHPRFVLQVLQYLPGCNTAEPIGFT